MRPNEFVTQAEIDGLPDDDPKAAFVTIVRFAQRRLREKTASIEVSDQTGWAQLQEARHGFMNVVIVAAKKFCAEPFASLDLPPLKDFGLNTHRQFRADLNDFITQLLLDRSSRARRD